MLLILSISISILPSMLLCDLIVHLKEPLVVINTDWLCTLYFPIAQYTQIPKTYSIRKTSIRRILSESTAAFSLLKNDKLR